MQGEVVAWQHHGGWLHGGWLAPLLAAGPICCVWRRWMLQDIRTRQPAALQAARKAHAAAIDEFVAVQFLFDRQWRGVKVGAGCQASLSLLLRASPGGGQPAWRGGCLPGWLGGGRLHGWWRPSLPAWLLSGLAAGSDAAHVWLQAYANAKGVGIVGDMPIYVGGQSADVWANQHLFELNADGEPEQVGALAPTWCLGPVPNRVAALARPAAAMLPCRVLPRALL